MAFGCWLGGHISKKPLIEHINDFKNASKEDALIIPSPYKNKQGEDAIKIALNDLPGILTTGFFQALHFWQDYKKYSMCGMFAKDFRTLTVQQKKVIDIFDDCNDLKLRDDAAREKASAEALAKAPKLRGF